MRGVKYFENCVRDSLIFYVIFFRRKVHEIFSSTLPLVLMYPSQLRDVKPITLFGRCYDGQLSFYAPIVVTIFLTRCILV